MTDAKPAEQHQLPDSTLEQAIRTALTGLRYGTVTLIVQDRQVIQIDKNEKIRLK